MKKIKKFIKKLLLFASIAFIATLLALVLYGYFYGDEVKQHLLGELNKQLNVKIDVNDIRFSLIKDFPRASIEFTDVKSIESGISPGGQLVNAGEISLMFNIKNLVSGNYIIDKIRIDNAFLNLVIDDKLRTNYDILNPAASGNGPQVKVEIENVEFNGVEVSFINQSSEQEYLFKINKGHLRGTFRGKENELAFQGNIHTSHIRSGKSVFMRDKDLQIDLALDTQDNFKNQNINRGTIDVQGLRIEATGSINSTAGNREVDLKIKSGKSKLSSVFALIPGEFLKPVESYDLKGQIKLEAAIKGKFSGDRIPAVSVGFEMDNGSLNYSPQAISLDKIAMLGTLKNNNPGNKKSYSLIIKNLSANVGNSNIKGNLSIVDFENPVIQASITSEFDLADLTTITGADTIQSINGKGELDLRFKNRINSFREFTVHDFISSQTTGSLTIHPTDFKLNGSPLTFKDFEGSFRFNNKDLIVEHFTGDVSESDFSMKGHFGNILAWAFLKDQPLFIRADMDAENIDLDQLLENPGSPDKNSARLSFSEHVNYQVDITCANFKFRKFRAQDISGHLGQENKSLHLTNGHLASMDGMVDISGSIDGKNSDNYFLNCSAETDQVNIRKLFSQFGNFGQTNLTDKHLNGTVTAHIDYSSRLTPGLHVDPASVHVVSDLTIEQGELIGYSPLYKLSRFIDIDELQHIRFSELNNRIIISDEVVQIPAMVIASSSLDIELSGTHSFDNQVDYHVKLKLADILNRDKKQIKQDLDDNFVKEDDTGQPNLFLSLTGDASDPVVKYDTKAVREKIVGDLSKEKETFKQLLHDEFAGNGKSQEKKPLSDLPSSGKDKDFKISWDESRTDSIPDQTPVENTHFEKQSQKKQKDFIISWDEEKDTIR